MSLFGDRIKPKQLKALVCLLHGGTEEEAATAARCTVQTLRNWFKSSTPFIAEYDRLFERQRDMAQADAHVLWREARTVVKEALAAVDEEGRPAYGPRLRAAELAGGMLERLSKRADQLQASATGPLIVLPGGAQPMALLIGSSTQPSTEPATQAPSIDVQAVPIPPVLPAGTMALEPQVTELQGSELEPITPGLPQWWRKSKPVNK